MNAYRVLITGIGGNVGQGVLKSLRAARRKFEIIGLDMNPLSAGFSLCDRYALVPRTSAPDFKESLYNICDQEKPEAIFACSPTELPFFSQQKDELEKRLQLAVLVNPAEVVRVGSDKFLTSEFLKRAGFVSPETALLQDEPGIERVIQKCGFPLILKPRDGFSSENVYSVKSRDEIKALQKLYPEAVLQENLEGEEYTSGTVSGKDGKVRAAILLHRELLQGTTYRTELIQNERLEEQVIAITDALGAVGPCNLQFKIKGDRVVVFEINPRFSGTSGLRHLYGFNDCEMSFELLRLGVEPAKPALKPAVVLRYWNEIVIPDSHFSLLKEGEIHRGTQTLVPKPIAAPVMPAQYSSQDERGSLNRMADKYFTEKALGPDRKQMDFIRDAVLSACRGPRVLELGCGSGEWTRILQAKGFKVTVVEGAGTLVENIRKNFGSQIEVHHSLFEEFQPAENFEDIIASCVLEHVENSRHFLNLLGSWLAPQGRLHIVVPNAKSLHRRVGLKMGLLKDTLELSPQELEVGHRRAYTPQSFEAELRECGFKVNFVKGIFLKPLSSGQMMDWSEALLEGYNAMSQELPEYTAFLYAQCTKQP